MNIDTVRRLIDVGVAFVGMALPPMLGSCLPMRCWSLSVAPYCFPQKRPDVMVGPS